MVILIIFLEIQKFIENNKDIIVLPTNPVHFLKMDHKNQLKVLFKSSSNMIISGNESVSKTRKVNNNINTTNKALLIGSKSKRKKVIEDIEEAECEEEHKSECIAINLNNNVYVNKEFPYLVNIRS